MRHMLSGFDFGVGGDFVVPSRSGHTRSMLSSELGAPIYRGCSNVPNPKHVWALERGPSLETSCGPLQRVVMGRWWINLQHLQVLGFGRRLLPRRAAEEATNDSTIVSTHCFSPRRSSDGCPEPTPNLLTKKTPRSIS